MKSNHERAWMCWKCGYAMDSSTQLTGEGEAKEDDVSLCMNCGSLYVRHHGHWVAMTATERASLTAEEVVILARAERARRQTITEDLNPKGGNA